MQFQTIEELNDYVEFLQMKGKEIPAWIAEEEERLKRESSISDDEYIFSTMAAHNKFMTPEKEKVVREMADQLMMDGEKATQPCLMRSAPTRWASTSRSRRLAAGPRQVW